MRKDEIIAIEFFTKESTREQMDVIVLDMWIFMEMKEIYIVGVWTIMILYLKERNGAFFKRKGKTAGTGYV